jgi:phosphoribosylaminoimidazolecarboxamide formyltransferase/IMP cyclohydrolase
MIRRALISVSDKTGLMPLARALNRRKVEILSTGGTARLLREQGIPVTEVSKFTGFPEILSGRVKTLHPKVHGGILADRASKEHRAQAKRLGLKAIDLVVVNLYPFEAAARRRNAPMAELIEQIDIGGVALIRSAAKNFKSVGILCRPDQYAGAIAEIEKNGTFSAMSLFRLAVEAFAESAYYDAVIHQTLAHREKRPLTRSLSPQGRGLGERRWPQKMVLGLSKRQELRYGENPHQSGVWYQWAATGGLPGGLAGARQLHGKDLSFNNLLDLDAALRLVFAFKKPTAAVVKHNNPCGAACAATPAEAFRRAFAGDPLSAFGGIVGLNRPVDESTARAIAGSGFLECVVAPGYRPGALKVLKGKKNLRIIKVPRKMPRECLDFRQVGGGLLAQQPDEFRKGPSHWRLATRQKPTAAQRKDLLFAWTVVRFVKSNAIVIAKDSQAVGIGMGLTSRVDSVAFALKKAGPHARGAVLASDGFFPKPDGPALAVRAGIRAIIQPGGSIQDPEVIKVAQKARVAMVLTGERHFKH